MSDIILFRFHKDFDVCKERVAILKYLNPLLPIYGLYGGPKKNYNQAVEALGDLVLDINISSSNDPKFKWFHADQTLIEWYFLFGRHLEFDNLYDYEADILTFLPLEKLYPRLKPKSIALSGVEKLEEVENIWEWTSKEPHISAFNKLCNFMDKEYGLKKPTYASLGPGPYLSKKFLEDFAESEQPHDLINPVVSEIIYPFYAQALGYEIINTGLHPSWFDSEKCEKYFNCEDIKIDKAVIKMELLKKHGVRAFHPVKYMFTFDEFLEWSFGML